MIDIAAESPAALRLAADFLTSHAQLREMSEVPAGTTNAASDNTAPFVSAAPTAPNAAYPSNEQAPTSAPPAPPTNAPAAGTPGMLAPLSPSSAATASPGVLGAPPAVEEYDDHGIPYDARIHQRGKSKKKDGSWKLQKGIADAVVTAVMQELAPRIRKPVSASFPPAVSGTPSIAQNIAAQMPLAPPPVSLPSIPSVPGQAPLVPPPPPPQETIAPEADPFRALVAKIAQARTANKLTAEEVAQCCAQAGAPNIQTLKAMPHLMPAVEAFIDAILAMR